VGGTLGRETKSEVVLASRLRAALAKLNPVMPAEAITQAPSDSTPLGLPVFFPIDFMSAFVAVFCAPRQPARAP